MNISDVAARLRGMDHILILTHVRPDGDTIGCASALCQALRDMDKEAYLLYNPEITATYEPYAAPYWAPEGWECGFLQRRMCYSQNRNHHRCFRQGAVHRKGYGYIRARMDKV